jgi:hypothetical protein
MTYIIYIFIVYAFFSYESKAMSGEIITIDGTILVVDHILPGYIVLGAESRDTHSKSGAHNREDDTCKIRRLDDHTAFSSSGRSRFRLEREDQTNSELYDAWDTAESTFLPGDDLANVAERWAMVTESAYYNAYLKDGDLVLSGLIPDSVVVGAFSGADGFKAETVTVKFSGGLSTVSFYHDPANAVEIGRIRRFSTPLGMAGFQEFWYNQSDRAQAVRAEIAKIINDKNYKNGEAEALIVKAAIDSAILWNGERDRQIGGETSVLILERGKPIKWFYESEICHQTWHD